MANFQTKLNLLKLDRAAVVNIKGVKETRKCVVIPCGDDTDIVLGEKGAYLNIAHWETANSQFGDTHVVKVSYSKERREKMTEEERRNKPFIGNSRPIEDKQMAVTATAAVEAPECLPF
jgi:hypothetical protein